MTELLSGLHQIGQVLGPRYLYQYLLTGRRSLLIDTGCASSPDATILPYFEQIGFQPTNLDYVLISHPDVDHSGGAARMRALAPRATFACHQLDARWISSTNAILEERYGWYRPFELDYPPETFAWMHNELGSDIALDLLLNGGETFMLDDERPIHVLHLPGHADGHLGLYDEANKAVIVIDAILGAGLLDMNGMIISPPPYSVIQPYLDAIDRVLALPFEHLYTAHYPPMNAEEGLLFLEQTKLFVYRCHAAVQDSLRGAGPLHLADVYARVNERVGPFSSFAVELAKPVYAHLEQLVVEGKAQRSDDRNPTWELIV